MSKVVDLHEYREQLDRGNRSAPSMLFDGLGADPVVVLDSEEVGLIGLDLAEARSDLTNAAKIAGRATDKDLHRQIMAIVAALNKLSGELAGEGGAA